MKEKSFLRQLVVALCLVCLTSMKPVQVLNFFHLCLLDNNRLKFKVKII